MVLDARKLGGEIVGEGIDFARNVLVVGTQHFLNPAEMRRIEAHVCNADFVCIEWDQIRDNQAKDLPGGYRDYLHHAYFDPTRLEGDHLYANLNDIARYDNLQEALGRGITHLAKIGHGIIDFRKPDGNEFLFIQELCRAQGKSFYFVDRLTSHMRHRVMTGFGKYGIVESFEMECRDRSRYMEAETLRIAQERFAATGRQEQCALFVGAGHLKDFPDGRYRKEDPHDLKN